MSRQAIDTAIRILKTIPALIEKEDYIQAFEKADKAQKLAEKENEPNLIHRALMAKGEIFDASCRLEEAVETYEKALDLFSDLFFEDMEKTSHQEILYSNLGKLGKTLEELDSVTKARQVCKKAEKNFEKILEAYKKLLAKNPENSEYFSNYAMTIENIWACYKVAEDLEKQIILVPDIVKNCEKRIESDLENLENYLRMDNIVRRTGEACLEKGLFEEAKNTYRQAYAVYKNIYEKYPENKLALNFLLFSHDYFGKLYAKIGEMDKVEYYYSLALDLAEEQLQKDPEDFSVIMNQGKIYREMGTLYSESEESEKAEFYYEKAMNNYIKLIGKRPEDPGYSYHLTEIFEELAEYFMDIFIVEKAKECYLKEIEIYESLIESEIDEIDNELNIAETFGHIANLYAEDNDTESAKEYYEKEMEIYKRLLSEFPEETDYELYIAETFNELGDLYFGDDEISALQYYEKALEITDRAVERAPEDFLSLSDHIKTLLSIAELNKIYEHYETSILFQQRILEFQLEITKRFPKDWTHMRDLGNTFSELGVLFEKIGDIKQAKRFHSNAVDTFSEIIFGRESSSTRRRMATEVQLRGFGYLRSKKYLSAEPYLRLAHKYYEEACEEETENSRNLDGLFSALYDFGLLHHGMENFEEAIESYKAAFSVLERLTEASPEESDLKAKKLDLYVGFGVSYSALNEFEKSKDVFEKALAINTELREKEPESVYHLEDKAKILKKYANLLLKTGKNAEAEAYKAESAELYKEVDAKDPILMKFREIGDI